MEFLYSYTRRASQADMTESPSKQSIGSNEDNPNQTSSVISTADSSSTAEDSKQQQDLDPLPDTTPTCTTPTTNTTNTTQPPTTPEPTSPPVPPPPIPDSSAPSEASEPSTPLKKYSESGTSSPALSNALMVKLRNILDSVKSQEEDLSRKTSNIQDFFELHKQTLSIAQATKLKLETFDCVRDGDDECARARKAEHKKGINKDLDKLECFLKKLSAGEKTYRSRDQNEERKKYKGLKNNYNTQSMELETLKIVNTEKDTQLEGLMTEKRQFEEAITSLTTAHEQLFAQTLTQHESDRETLLATHESKLESLETKHKKEIEVITASHEEKLSETIQKHKDELSSLQGAMDGIANEHEGALQAMQCAIDTMREEHASIVQSKDQALMKRDKEYGATIEALEGTLVEKASVIAEYKEVEKAQHELMREWQAQKKEKNAKIDALCDAEMGLKARIEELEAENEGLQETTALNAIQMSKKDALLADWEIRFEERAQEIGSMERDKKLLEAKLKVSIKEIIKLRAEVKEREESRIGLEVQLCAMETAKNVQIRALDSRIEGLREEVLLVNDECCKRFKCVSGLMSDVHCKLESFSVTIRNFSGHALRQSFETELEARLKSNQELPAWQENIKKQLQKATQQMMVIDNMNESANGYIKELEREIAHVKLTGLQILHEYTSLLMEYNSLYIGIHEQRGLVKGKNGRIGRKKSKSVIIKR